MLVCFASLVFLTEAPGPLRGQELERTFCDDADPANHCPGEDCVCSDDTLEVVFGEDLSGSVFEYDALPEGGLRVASVVAANVHSSQIRGWAFGVAHDEAVLNLSMRDLVLVGTAAEPALVGDGFARRVLPGGYITGIVLNFSEPVVLPVERVSLIRATYTLVRDVGPEGTKITFTNLLGNPPTDIVFTVDQLRFPDMVDHDERNCVNGIDDDRDGLTDRDDDDCVVRDGVSRRPRTLVDGLIRRRGAAPERFRRGDADANGRINLADGLAILQSVFGAPVGPACADALDSNDDGQVTLADALPPLRYVFGMGPPLAAPFDACGNDPTPDALGCVEARCTGP